GHTDKRKFRKMWTDPLFFLLSVLIRVIRGSPSNIRVDSCNSWFSGQGIFVSGKRIYLEGRAVSHPIIFQGIWKRSGASIPCTNPCANATTLPLLFSSSSVRRIENQSSLILRLTKFCSK